MDRTGHPEAEAWHEAGHAVVAHLLGGRVRRVSLEDEIDGLDGHAAIEWRCGSRRERAERSGRASLGGPLAELVYRGDDDLEDLHVLAAWDADWEEVEAAARIVERDAARRISLIRSWIDDVRALLDDPDVAERVARVADALDAHGALDDELFEDAVG
ncbi:MAG: hypothetical protein ACYSWX_09050 [Planctomycetota bacterium]|jgi:hypothetical protein